MIHAIVAWQWARLFGLLFELIGGPNDHIPEHVLIDRDLFDDLLAELEDEESNQYWVRIRALQFEPCASDFVDEIVGVNT
jgi:hypothetical protein